MISLEEHFGQPQFTFEEEQEILSHWENNFDASDADSFLKLNVE